MEDLVSIRDLRTFLAIAESGSFAAASRSVRRTQSAVTVQMKALEDEFGILLFDRARRPPVLSPGGRAFLPRAIEAVEAYDRLYQVGNDTQVEGHLRLGVVPSVITGVMPKALVSLRARYPAVHVELSMGLSKELVGRVERGLLDAAVISDFKKSKTGLLWSPFAEEPLVLIAPFSAPGRRAEDLIATYPFIRYSRQTWVGEAIDTFLKRRRLKIQETMSLDTLEAITAMVHNGLGVSIVPLRASDDVTALQVRIVPFSGIAARRVVGIVQAPSHPKAALVDMLLYALKLSSRVTVQPARPVTPKKAKPDQVEKK
jgi:DNA-binding transcriptional LysR family regulator